MSGIVIASALALGAACSSSTSEAPSEGADAVRVCAHGATVKGVDVAYYEGDVDWSAVKASGRAFAFARVSDGTGHIDAKFAQNWSGIRAAGLVRGAYQYFHPGQDPIAQADLLLTKIGALGVDDLPPVLDIEVTDGLGASTVQARMRQWLAHVEQATGRRPMIYTAAFMSATVGTSFAGYPLWVANFGATCPSMPSGWSAWRFWQTSESGTVPGIQGTTDLDVFNGTLADLHAFANGNAPPPDAGAPPPDAGGPPPDAGPPPSGARGFPVAGPWVSFYGPAAGLDVARIASTFRVINLDADPAGGNVTDAQIQTLRAGGANRVISYLNLGSCEFFRSYWTKCQQSGALTSPYDGYPDEMWANLSNAAYRNLMVNDVAARLWARGVDGFYLDNLEVVEHGSDPNGPCNAACSQGGLDLVWELRQRFPNALIVMQNATSDVTLNGTTHGMRYADLLDGVAHEEVYGPGGSASVRSEMLAWKNAGLRPGGRAFWLATEDYVGTCSSSARSQEQSIVARAQADGISPYVTDASAKQQAPCYW